MSRLDRFLVFAVSLVAGSMVLASVLIGISRNDHPELEPVGLGVLFGGAGLGVPAIVFWCLASSDSVVRVWNERRRLGWRRTSVEAMRLLWSSRGRLRRPPHGLKAFGIMCAMLLAFAAIAVAFTRPYFQERLGGTVWIGVAPFATYVGLAVATLVWHRLAERSRLRGFAARLAGGSVERVGGGRRVTGSLDGLSLSLVVTHPRGGGEDGGGSPGWLRFELLLPQESASEAMEVTRAGLTQRLARRLERLPTAAPGPGKEDPLEEGVADRFRFTHPKTAKEELPARLLQMEETERALDQLFDGFGFESATIADGKLSAWLGAFALSDLRPEKLEAMSRCLLAIARLCQRKEIVLAGHVSEKRFGWTGGSAEVLCPYCRDAVALDSADLTSCTRCHTVHHAGCFREAGGCTIFGCGAREPASPSGARAAGERIDSLKDGGSGART